ncbi:MAG: hypothetical protein QOI15_946, partial [Pseudonocardiales bacterium]|nr:hypothetical protein [Pseudonocardiales bacterium]
MRPSSRFELSATQLIASALAAVTATVAASYLGVTGTVIGAGLASVVSAIGTAVYTHSLRTTRARVRRDARPEPPGLAGLHPSAGLTLADSPADERKPEVPRQQGRLQGVMIGALTVFVAVLVVVTGVEVVTGRPLSDLVRGDTGTGTTFFGDTQQAAADEPAPAPTVTQTVTPSVVVTTPTVTQ